ncbi:hypothetical protein NFI96_030939 [Prochilodus magdalenae]|nr:hypothetical protein NFI96_030939 [Prochilodus magdalenae]
MEWWSVQDLSHELKQPWVDGAVVMLRKDVETMPQVSPQSDQYPSVLLRNSMRTLEEVQATLQIAKLKEEDLQAVTHCLSFGDNAASGDYCLMELDETLCEHIEAGRSLIIRGDKDEHAVLCSEEKTYDLKMADTSNLLLFVPGCRTPDQLGDHPQHPQLVHAQIWGYANSYWELRRQRPRLKKLKKLLMESPYDGPPIGTQEEAPETKYTMEDLLERIQASREEIEAQLQNIHACEIEAVSVRPSVRLSVCPSVRLSVRPSVRPSVCPSVRLSVRPSVCLPVCLSARLSVCPSARLSVCPSVCLPVWYWRILDFDYELKLLGHVTQLVDSESWSFSRVPLKTCLEELGPLEPTAMIEHCLNCYGRQYNTEEGEVVYALDEDKVCRAMAQMLLQNAVKFNLSEFQEVWQQSVPEGMGTRLDQLRGLALVDRNSRPETISLLRVEDLPEDTLERFTALFSMREKWTQDDIEPYIHGSVLVCTLELRLARMLEAEYELGSVGVLRDLCGEKQTTGALLTKHARSSMQNGSKVYNSRRPVAT